MKHMSNHYAALKCKITPLTLVCLVLLGLVGCKPAATEQMEPKAELVLTQGRIYTLDKKAPWAEAVAIREGRYQFVGSHEAVQAWIGPDTQVLDLAGKMLMPGINDAHVHPVMGGLKMLYECNFPFTATPEVISTTLAGCVAQNPDADWIIGGQWDSDLFVKYSDVSPKGLLDAVSGDKAVLLSSDSGHDGWANSKALALAGIDAASEAPAGGVIVKDSKTKEPNGLLLENAKERVEKLLPQPTQEQYRRALEYAMQQANGYGITAMKDAWASEAALAAMQTLAKEQAASLYLAASIDVKYGLEEASFNAQKLKTLSEQYAAPGFGTQFVKIFLDGVPTSSRTAAMLADYLPEAEGGHSHNGALHFEEDALATMITALDRLGLTVKIHTAGDRSVQVTLNAIEQARKANGDSGLRHELAHAGYIDDQDLPRFAQLNAVADLSPYLWHPSPIIDSVLGAVGARGQAYWPIKALIEQGAPLAAGSDWPAAVPSIDPWVGIEAMVTRADPRAEFPGTFWPEQAVTLAEALEIYTLGGARALGLEQQTGSIEKGKSADFILLEQNLFELPADQINEIRVLKTYFKGQVVYEHSQH